MERREDRSLVQGTEGMVGDGPRLRAPRTRSPEAVFTGARFGAELAWHYAAAALSLAGE